MAPAVIRDFWVTGDLGGRHEVVVVPLQLPEVNDSCRIPRARPPGQTQVSDRPEAATGGIPSPTAINAAAQKKV